MPDQDPVAQAAQRIQQQRAQTSERDRLLAEVYRRSRLREQRELAETLAYVKSYVDWLRQHHVPPIKLGRFRRLAWPVAVETDERSVMSKRPAKPVQAVRYVTPALRFCDERGRRYPQGYVPDMRQIAPGVATYLADIGLAELWTREH